MSRKLTGEEKSLWQSIARHIVPLHPQKEIKAAIKKAEEKREIIERRLKAKHPKPVIKPLPLNKPEKPAQDVDRSTLQRFRRGQMPIEATIDLHGNSVKDAYFVMRGFLADAYKRQLRCVLVIHGKGSMTGDAKIKRAMPDWLTELPDIILSHAPAKIQHGGQGASYILLRRKRVTS